MAAGASEERSWQPILAIQYENGSLCEARRMASMATSFTLTMT